MSELDVSRSEFHDLADGSEPVVVRVEASLDVSVDPLAAYATLADGTEYGFLLESAEKIAASDPQGAFDPAHVGGDRHARYSFIGYDPDAVVSLAHDGDDVTVHRDSLSPERFTTGDGDVLDRLRETLPDVERRNFPDAERQLLDGGLVGFLAYDAVYDLWLDDVGLDHPETTVPDAEFVLTTRTVVFDHHEERTSIVFTPIVEPGEDVESVYDSLAEEAESIRAALDSPTELDLDRVTVRSTRTDPRGPYEDAVATAKEAIFDGDIYQAVISRVREMEGSVDPLSLYAALRAENPSPYMYVLAHGERTIVGSSPETLCSVSGETVLNNPIAGTCPRGNSPIEDRRLAGEMLADEKERAEHTMLVDLARNDVRRVSRAGSVSVPEFMSVLKYSHVQHIESTVTGTLRVDQDAFDAVRASFPAGTLSGAPKIRAMEYIDALEAEPRGIYGGGVGYVSWTGDAEFAIVIRTALVEHGDPDRVTVRAGAGVVADSDPTAEYEETEAKMDGVLASLERVQPDIPEASR